MRGKAGPRPGPVKSKEERAAERELAKLDSLRADLKEFGIDNAAGAGTIAALTGNETSAQLSELLTVAKAEKKEADKKKRDDDAAAKKAAKKAAKGVDDQTPGIGHNSVPLTDDERRALLVNGIGKIIGFQEQIATINSDLRNERKRLIAHGFEAYEINFAIELRKSEDEKGDLDKWRKMQRVAAFMNHPIGTQPDLFDKVDVDRTPAVDRAYENGKMDGMEAKGPLQPPYDPSTEQYEKYCQGWHDGQAALVRKNIKPVAETQDAQAAFDDVLPDEGFEQAVPDHARDPSSPANPINQKDAMVPA